VLSKPVAEALPSAVALPSALASGGRMLEGSVLAEPASVDWEITCGAIGLGPKPSPAGGMAVLSDCPKASAEPAIQATMATTRVFMEDNDTKEGI
jgi:hypothetical protein